MQLISTKILVHLNSSLNFGQLWSVSRAFLYLMRSAQGVSSRSLSQSPIVMLLFSSFILGALTAPITRISQILESVKRNRSSRVGFANGVAEARSAVQVVHRPVQIGRFPLRFFASVVTRFLPILALEPGLARSRNAAAHAAADAILHWARSHLEPTRCSQLSACLRWHTGQRSTSHPMWW